MDPRYKQHEKFSCWGKRELKQTKKTALEAGATLTARGTIGSVYLLPHNG